MADAAKIIFTEGDAPLAPASGQSAIYAKTDHKFYRKDSTGTELEFGASGDVSTDVIWDAAGDLVVGTGANTAIKLTKGTEGKVLTAGATTLSWETISTSLSSQTPESILANATENTAVPSAMPIAEQTIVGRVTGRHVEDLSAGQVRTLLNVADGATNYAHPTGDGNLHIPANSTTNSGKVLTAGAVAGTYTWETAATGGDVATDTLWDAAGDLVVGTGANTAGILTKGSEGKVLTAGASTLSWETPSAIGLATSISDGDITHAPDGDTVYHALAGKQATGLSPLNSQATAENDFLVGAATPFGSWAKKTLAETKTVLGLGSAAYTDSTAYDPAGTAAGKIAASISNGDITHSPDGNSVYDALVGKESYHGVQAIGTISFDNTEHTLSVASVTYWYQGVSFTTATPTVCDFDLTADRDHASASLTTGVLYYFYFKDVTGKLYWSPVFWNLKTMIPVATVFWNGSAGAISKESHNHTRNIDWHIWSHLTVGARYGSGLDKTYPSTSVDESLQIETGTVYDEDLTVTTGQQTTMRGYYKTNSTTWTFADFAFPFTGSTGAPTYLNTGTYVLTTYADNRYACYWVFATTDIDKPIAVIPSHVSASYSQITTARTEVSPVIAGINPEWKLIYRFIYAGDGQFIESADYRLQSSLAGAVSSATTAGAVSFTPSGGVIATTVQGAIEELDAEKAPISGAALVSATINALTPTALATGFTIAGGTKSKTLTVPLDASVSGTNTGDKNLARVNHSTTPADMTVADCSGFNVFTNTGATAEVVMNLPAGADGLRLPAIITAAYDFTFVADGTETIRYLSTVSKAGGSIKSASIGDELQLDWNGTQWVASVLGLSTWWLETS